MKSPLFIFSQPRAGSTLLQRMLVSHPQIASHAEPWVLLSPAYGSRSTGAYTEYGHDLASTGVNDFIEAVGDSELRAKALHSYGQTLYEAACSNGEQYFLDKTPRYYLIIDEIMQAFPEAKCIFLLRNPLAVLASIISTWNNGSFKHFHSSAIDLYQAPTLLANAMQKYKDRSYVVQYEDIVGENNTNTMEALFGYLDLSPADNWDAVQKQQFSGTLGDPTGVKEYTEITQQSLNKWKTVLNTPFKKHVARKYIEATSNEAWDTMGYSRASMLQDISGVPTRYTHLVRDPLTYMGSYMAARFSLYAAYTHYKASDPTLLR